MYGWGCEKESKWKYCAWVSNKSLYIFRYTQKLTNAYIKARFHEGSSVVIYKAILKSKIAEVREGPENCVYDMKWHLLVDNWEYGFTIDENDERNFF